MICRENGKEKQGEEEMMRHQVFHASCLVTHTRGRKGKVLEEARKTNASL
jgi:hypothetical protein